jgi:hypothetical protein
MHMLNPGQPDATTPGLFPLPAGPARGKLRQKYRALADAILRVWDATINSDVEMHPGHFHVDCEQVVLDTAAALVVIRTIDTLFAEALAGPDKARYRQMWTTDPDGRVVRGMVLVRNTDVHAHSLIEMESPRLVSGVGRGAWRVFPRWQDYASLPAEVQNNTRTARSAHDRYKDSVGGRLVIETLLDVMRFFDRCDPSMARRADVGDLEGFPLTAFIEHDYERRHPYWPSWDEVNTGLLDLLTSERPGGTERQIRRKVAHGDKILFVGFTSPDAVHMMSFLESAEQVTRDVVGGFRYTAITKAAEVVEVTLNQSRLFVGDTPLADVELADTAGGSELIIHRSDEWLTGYWEQLITDGFRYRQHRRPQ